MGEITAIDKNFKVDTKIEKSDIVFYNALDKTLEINGIFFESSVRLDLGDVKYSCEVIVNGESVGVCIARPYALWIDKKYLKQDNELVIIVANTAANQYATTKVFDTWDEKKVGPYQATAMEFEKESVEGGLIGPVRILA